MDRRIQVSDRVRHTIAMACLHSDVYFRHGDHIARRPTGGKPADVGSIGSFSPTSDEEGGRRRLSSAEKIKQDRLARESKSPFNSNI